MTPALAMLSALATLVPGQQQPPPNAPEFGGSSPVGLVVIVALFIAMFFLVRSMNTHLRKVPTSFDKPEPGSDHDQESGDGQDPGEQDAGGGTAPAGGRADSPPGDQRD